MAQNGKKRGLSFGVLITLLSLALLVTVTAGITLARLFMQSREVHNGFAPAQVSVTVDEDFDNGDTVKSDVRVRNTGSTGAYVRAAIVVTWQDANGKVLSDVPQLQTDYTLTQTDSGWFDGGDGYYYWSQPVPEEATTGTLIDRCEVVADAPVEGYTLHIDILAQAVQSAPREAVEAVWPVQAASDGKLQK